MISNICTKRQNLLNNYNHQQNRQKPSFAGKISVEMNFLGTRYDVPRVVADTRRTVKNAFFSNPTRAQRANAINLFDNVFLGVAHILSHFDNESKLGIGKVNNRRECFVNFVENQKLNKGLDLSLLWAKISQKTLQVSKSIPVKFAKKAPTHDEIVYIIGYHDNYKGPKALPVSYLTESKGDFIMDMGQDATISFVYPLISKNKISGNGLSGSLVANEKGEMVGIVNGGFLNADDPEVNGILSFIGLKDIKRFLKEHNIIVDKDGFAGQAKKC